MLFLLLDDPEEISILEAAYRKGLRRMNEKLRLARINKHLSEREVCRVIGADLRTYQHWESGRHLPQPYYRKKLCTFFGLTLEELGFDPQTLLFAHTGVKAPPAPSGAMDAFAKAEIQALPTDMLAISMLALRIGQQERGWSQQQVQEYVMSQMSHQNQPGTITRREFGLLLAGLPLAGLALTDVPEELFPHCSANLTTAWKLAKGSDLPLAQSIVQAYLPALLPLAERPSRYQQEAAELVTKSFILNGMIEMHLGNLAMREQSCQQAVKYAEVSGNIELLVAARRWLGGTYYYLSNPAQQMKEYQRAEGFLDQVTPLLRSGFLASISVVQAQQQQKQQALTSLGQAQECFFVEASENQNTLYIGHDFGILTLHAGRTYYALGAYQQSLETLLQINGLQPKRPTSERSRIELLNQQTLAAAKLNDLELAMTYMEAAVTGAVELGSKQRFSEAKNIYQILQFLWPNETKVAGLRPIFQERLI